MKKIVLFAATVVASISFANAQTGTRFGVKGGANYSTFEGKDAPSNVEYKFGAHAGIFADFGVSEMVSIRPEVLYSNKGWGIDNKTILAEGGKEKTELKYNLNYIDVPVLAHINAGNLFFELGPYASFLVDAKQKYNYKVKDGSGNVTSEGSNESESFTSQYNRIDFGYAAGVGYQLTSGLGFGVRYNGGVNKLGDSDANRDMKIRNSAFQTSVSYMFGAK